MSIRGVLWGGVVGMLVIGACGCQSIGPRTVARDRFDYSASVGESWKRQTLLNIVKLRYLDPPIFVDVGQIVGGYTLETSVNASGTAFEDPNRTPANNNLTIGGRATYTDRPTITYTPLTGNRFVKSLLNPLPVDAVFYMIQGGWPADFVLFATASSLNGLKNQESTARGASPPDPDFLKALALIRKIQLSGGVALRVQQDAQKNQTNILTFRRSDIAPEVAEDSAELRRLLHLDPRANEFRLVFGATATDDKEVAVVTRSIMQLMQTLSANVQVPAQDLAEHRASPGIESIANLPEAMRIIDIHSGKAAPRDAFVAVPYRDQWFWIDDTDLKSKRVFSGMLLLFTLADSGQKEPLPTITIPAQ